MTPLYPQKLALTSPTGGGRSVGIVRSRTKATEFFFCVVITLKPQAEHVAGSVLGPHSFPSVTADTKNRERLRMVEQTDVIEICTRLYIKRFFFFCELKKICQKHFKIENKDI